MHKLIKEPSDSVLKRFAHMARPETPALVQARTGKLGLRQYLYSIGAEKSKEYPCRQGFQTVEHVLLCCPKFEKLREKDVGR